MVILVRLWILTGYSKKMYGTPSKSYGGLWLSGQKYDPDELEKLKDLSRW